MAAYMPAVAAVIPVVISSVKKWKNVKVCAEDLHRISTEGFHSKT